MSFYFFHPCPSDHHCFIHKLSKHSLSVYIFHRYVWRRVSRVSVWSDSKNRSLPLTTPINMTSRKHIGIINHSVTCLKILSFSSRWQHGLPLIPFIQIPAHLCLIRGITFWNVWWKNRERAEWRLCSSSTFSDESLLCWWCCLFAERAGSIFSLRLLQSNRQLSVLTNWLQVLM